MFIATVFTSCGEASAASRPTPEAAIEAATAGLSDLARFTATYRPHDGVVFVNGVPCGVVYETARCNDRHAGRGPQAHSAP